ncbi:MAG: hemerythrin domain-containing protein [Bdellovibrionales bacterium]|nr:hemerythrin domain-containing protein [Oligoflexia bacterium]
MNTEGNTLENLKVSLEHDLNSQPHLLAVLEKHHDFLDESLSVLVDPNANLEDKKLHLMRFVHVINMHGRAEEETLYPKLMQSGSREARFQAHVSKTEFDLAFQLSDEIRDLEQKEDWSDEVDAKTKVMASLVRTHLREEERLLFPLAKKTLDPEVIEQMTLVYLDKCIQYLELVIDSQPVDQNDELSVEKIHQLFKHEINSLRH